MQPLQMRWEGRKHRLGQREDWDTYDGLHEKA
jgi:hypothetical protein